MTITLSLPQDLQQRLTQEASRVGMPPAEYAVRLLDQHLPPTDRGAALAALFQSWEQDDDAEEQKETGDWLIQALDEDRLSDRKLFPPEFKGVAW